MIKRANVLMVGGSGRKCGKTEFVCQVIKQFAKSYPVTAVKITVIRDGGCCPRGAENSCGACLISNDFDLAEEPEGTTKVKGISDTERMKAAGAEHVYWLRIKLPFLRQGILELLEKIPIDVPIVMESNSARLELEPGLFIVFGEEGSTAIKPSCQSVLCYADAIFISTGNRVSAKSIAPNRLLYKKGTWFLHEEAGGIVLAGGKSSRMECDKSLLKIGESPMISVICEQLQKIFPNIIIGCNNPNKYQFLNLSIVPDRNPDMGPLMGLVSCLYCSAYQRNFVMGCDIPLIHAPFVRQMMEIAHDVDIVMPINRDGKYEPLFAIYCKSVIPVAEKILVHGGGRLIELLKHVKVHLAELPSGDWYYNLNMPLDYQKFCAWRNGAA